MGVRARAHTRTHTHTRTRTRTRTRTHTLSLSFSLSHTHTHIWYLKLVKAALGNDSAVDICLFLTRAHGVRHLQLWVSVLQKRQLRLESRMYTTCSYVMGLPHMYMTHPYVTWLSTLWDLFWLRGWLINKGAICTRTAPLFWHFNTLFEKATNKISTKNC